MMLFLIYLIHTHYGDDIYNLNLNAMGSKVDQKNFNFSFHDQPKVHS